MLLDHSGETGAAARLMTAVAHMTSNAALHTPGLGGAANAAGDRRSAA